MRSKNSELWDMVELDVRVSLTLDLIVIPQYKGPDEDRIRAKS